MLTPEETLTQVGHAVGGVCPFAVNENVTVYLDKSLQRFETVFPACGSSNSAIELSMRELERYSDFKCWVEVCRIPKVRFIREWTNNEILVSINCDFK